MKKLILSLVVVFSFLAYSVHQSSEKEATQVIPPIVIPTVTIEPTQTSTIPTATTDSPAPTVPPPPTAAVVRGIYKDGEYVGSVADAFYGNIQVKAVIQNGKITDVLFLQYPSDRRTSIEINTQAMPFLKQEAIQAQNAQVDIVSGATDSSRAFIESLGSALAQAT